MTMGRERQLKGINEFRIRAHCPMNCALPLGRALRRPPLRWCCQMFPQTCSVQGEVVRTAGAQRSARPTFRLVGNCHLQRWTRIEAMNVERLHLTRLRGEGPYRGRVMDAAGTM